MHPMLAPTLAVLIVAGYATALWWLLRRESTDVLLVVTVLSCLSLSLRLVYTTDYPAGLYEDEPNLLQSAMAALRAGKLFGQSSVIIPVLLGALFEAQLVPILGPTRWAIRSYSLITSVLATPAMFAVARALGLRIGPSVAAAALFIVLPWSLLYGRIHLGGELLFHQLLLLAVLARLIWRNGSWAEVGIGGCALCLLCYDYWAGRTMLGMPVVAAVLARGRQRLLCLLVIVVALLGCIPQILARPEHMITGVTEHIRPELLVNPAADLYQRIVLSLDTFVHPVAANGWATIQAGAMQPLLILALALVGVVINPNRRGVFLLVGFFGGLAGAFLSNGPPSTHRMMMAFVFIPLAAACVFDVVRWRVVCAALATIVVLIVGFQSVRLYFSNDYWLPESRWLFDWERTALVEALPPAPHAKLIVAGGVGYYFTPLSAVDSNWELLTAENWFPPNHEARIYAFEPRTAELQAFYASVLGYQRVQTIGRAFLVNLEARDWSWLRQHGWVYEAHCGTTVGRGQVPVLFQQALTFKDLRCDPSTHIWRGRWNGPRATVRFKWSGAGVIETSQGRVVEQTGFERIVDFNVEPDSPVTISVTPRPGEFLLAELLEVSPAGERIPAWERITPIESPPSRPLLAKEGENPLSH